MKTSDTSASSSPSPTSWLERRRLAESDSLLIIKNPEDNACAERLRASAGDPKWEIRKVIAEALAIFPEALARELAAKLASDNNSMVRSAAERSISRRSPGSGLSSSHSSVIQTELERFERKFGVDARQEAFRLAECTAFLHVRTAVHDIKNILTHFNVDTASLLKFVSDSSTKSRLQRLEKGRHYLIRLVEMMEDYSRDLDLIWQPEDLVEVARESIAAARDQVQNEGKDSTPVECELRGSKSIILPISRFHFAMVLTNLIKNAIQAHAISDKELRLGRVIIELSASDDGARVVIFDTGRGIAPGDLQKLLDFVPGGSSKPGGMGYGLPICRRYIEAHAGELIIRSEEDKGTEITITLPTKENF